MTSSYEDLIAQTIKLVDQKIADLLPKGQDRICQAMRYSALSPGKRLRPFILMRSADIFDVPQQHSLRVAAAIEITHSYSLIHDDLPAMDDDDFRRGMPSCHKKFDEATAILAGDALLTIAFEILAHKDTHPDPKIRCELVAVLAKNIGYSGMAGGQMLDLIYEKETNTNYAQLVNSQYMKTAKLFMACCEMGAVLGSASKEEKESLLEYGKNFGLAFQFIDDLEDILEPKPLSNNNIIQIIGKEKTLTEAKNFIKKSREKIKIFNNKNIFLDKLASQLLNF